MRRLGTASRRPRPGWRGRRSASREGIALLMVLVAITVVGAMVTELHEVTGSAHAVAVAQRDRLRAETMARSTVDLVRLLTIKEPAFRAAVGPLYQAAFGRKPPQLPVWTLADTLLRPFCDGREEVQELFPGLRDAKGMDPPPAHCEHIVAFAENSKINVNDPLFFQGDRARRSVAMQLFALMGGYHSPSPYDVLFERPDPDGLVTTRQDVVSAIIDWWDPDSQRTFFDPGRNEVSSSGSEDDVYATFDDPYHIKNAPLDSVEELRLVRGIGDDFWATFIEPDPDDPASRTVTVYASGKVNVNESPPQVLLARLCSYAPEVTLCSDPAEAAKFIQLLQTARAIAPVPFFSRPRDFLDFLQGRGGARGLYPMLAALLGPDNPLLFRPITLSRQQRRRMAGAFTAGAYILTIDVTAVSGRATVRVRTIFNHHPPWTPPPPNAGKMPPLGVFHYYRID